MHCCLWKQISVIVKHRDQDDLLPIALREIGCTYLSYQVSRNFATKKKSYDGSTTLKMTGADCIKLEEQIEKFARLFLRPGQMLEGNDQSTIELRKPVEMFSLSRKISRELRALETTPERVQVFRVTAEKLFLLMQKHCPAESTKSVLYVHALRDYVTDMMEFWFKLLDWGYGYFSCTASEHLNKQLK